MTLESWYISIFTGTRLRAPEKLRTNLEYQNAVSQADDDGFNFPSATTAELQEALAALVQNDEVEEEEVEEEVIGWDWEELEEVAEMLWLQPIGKLIW